VIIFPLVQTVGADAKLVRTFTYENYLDVRGYDSDSFSKANRLWKVDFIPCKDEQPPDDPHRLTRRLLELPGYLHFLDEKNGFLMTWIYDTAWSKREAKQKIAISWSPSGIQPKSNRVIMSISPNMWKQKLSDRESGTKVPDTDARRSQRSDEVEDDKDGQVSVNFTARLDVHRLLEDILLRRPTLVPGYDQKDQNNWLISTFPCYSFDLVAVTDGGRKVELVVAFEIGKAKGSIGVVLSVDILTQTYKELQWGKGADVQYDPASDSVTKLSAWCNNLALQRRMRQQRAGPYSCFPNHPSDWSWLCQGPSSGLEQEDGWDPEIWKALTLKLEAFRREQFGRCSLVSQSLVYPDCELADNQAVISRLPVFSMGCTSGPTKLVYG
jgi:hypothetical protein